MPDPEDAAIEAVAKALYDSSWENSSPDVGKEWNAITGSDDWKQFRGWARLAVAAASPILSERTSLPWNDDDFACADYVPSKSLRLRAARLLRSIRWYLHV